MFRRRSSAENEESRLQGRLHALRTDALRAHLDLHRSGFAEVYAHGCVQLIGVDDPIIIGAIPTYADNFRVTISANQLYRTDRFDSETGVTESSWYAIGGSSDLLLVESRELDPEGKARAWSLWIVHDPSLSVA